MLLLAIVAALWVRTAWAQALPREEQVVVWPLVGNGGEYRRVAYPRQVDPLRVLADTPIVLEARRAQVYFWPLTREYLADFTALNEPLAGTLEIVSAGGEVRRIAPRRYTLWYPDGAAGGRSELLFDELAQEAYDTYVREARAAAEATRAFEQRRADYYVRVQAWLQQAAARVQPLPPPPPEFTETEPPPYRAYAAEIEEAPVVSLPPGEYRLRWRGPDGAVVADSERRVVSFAPRRRAVGYRILPEGRWTQAETSYDPDEVLYVGGDDVLYLQPIAVEEYNAALYARLLRPQTLEAPDPSLYVWVPRGAVSGTRLALWDGGQRLDTVPEVPYRVTQRGGAAFGYSIEPAQAAGATLAPDFVAMRVPPEPARISGLSLIGPDGVEVPNSRREIRPVRAVLDALVYLPAAIPLLLTILTRLRRHRTRPAMRASHPVRTGAQRPTWSQSDRTPPERAHGEIDG